VLPSCQASILMGEIVCAEVNKHMILTCSILAWGMLFSICWTVAHHCQSGFFHVKRLHEIPCYECKYFTNSCYLKCTVNPQTACSEAAINCQDYQNQS
jgi:hypothetical protein